ncbi:hypothetical protein DBV15_05235 [Temnothorax longispinosus]|uniref:Uncharacterized protein n=1 Tax=Temnothorax longispinosus TaxID=300112 RepID=A0A4S2KLH5_9HYME|nr:hypothetical protein DBV15_05235 [Temnothorax longispinosus]
MFLRLPSYRAPTERHRVHIFVTMTYVEPTPTREGAKERRESEMMRGRYEEERKETSERRGGAKGGIVGGRRTGNEGWTMQGRGRAETLKWFETGSRTVAHFDPLGGWRTSYSTRAGCGRQLGFGYRRAWRGCEMRRSAVRMTESAPASDDIIRMSKRSGEARDKAACPTRVRFEELSSNQITGSGRLASVPLASRKNPPLKFASRESAGSSHRRRSRCALRDIADIAHAAMLTPYFSRSHPRAPVEAGASSVVSRETREGEGLIRRAFPLIWASALDQTAGGSAADLGGNERAEPPRCMARHSLSDECIYASHSPPTLFGDKSDQRDIALKFNHGKIRPFSLSTLASARKSPPFPVQLAIPFPEQGARRANTNIV